LDKVPLAVFMNIFMFAPVVVSDGGVVFTTIQDFLLDPACYSGGMFVRTGDFDNTIGISANTP
jgi:hypothetical protein